MSSSSNSSSNSSSSSCHSPPKAKCLKVKNPPQWLALNALVNTTTHLQEAIYACTLDQVIIHLRETHQWLKRAFDSICELDDDKLTEVAKGALCYLDKLINKAQHIDKCGLDKFQKTCLVCFAGALYALHQDVKNNC